MRKVAAELVIMVVALAVCMASLKSAAENQNNRLSVGFYDKTCPGAYAAIRNVVKDHISRAPTLAAPLLRLQFHDCFVRGCDGSVLLNSTANSKAEKDAGPNLNLRGYHVIDAAKAAVEELCPATVSCADVVAVVARDAVQMIGGPFWEVETGRRDGMVSLANEVIPNLPGPTANISTLEATFAVKGLSLVDVAVLSGSHTIGTAHCPAFVNRLYNFSSVADVDPTLDPAFAEQLRRNKCRSTSDTRSAVEMDPGSFRTFDNHYYVNILKRRVLFQSDAALLTHPLTSAYVASQARNPPSGPTFMEDFAAAMRKMGQISVLTGSTGQIRRHCAVVNS